MFYKEWFLATLFLTVYVGFQWTFYKFSVVSCLMPLAKIINLICPLWNLAEFLGCETILFSSVAHFWLNGYLNNQIYLIWVEEQPEKVGKDRNATVNGERYRAIITTCKPLAPLWNEYRELCSMLMNRPHWKPILKNLFMRFRPLCLRKYTTLILYSTFRPLTAQPRSTFT